MQALPVRPSGRLALVAPWSISAAVLIALLAGPALAPTAAAAAAPGSLEPIVRAADPSRPEDSSRPYWIFLRDKGLPTSLDRSAALEAARDRLTPRALARRAKVRTEPVDLLDVPLHEPYVRAVLGTGARKRHALRWLNAVTVDATPAQVREIEGLPFVDAVRPVARRQHDPIRNVRPAEGGAAPAPRSSLNYGECSSQILQIEVDRLHDAGLSGDGVLVAVLDTGFDTTVHEAFQGIDVQTEWDFVQGDGNTANEGSDPTNQFYHGTLVLSMIGGWAPGHLIGPAYGSTFALAKTEDLSDETPAEEDNWAAAAQWADSLGADVITSSLGYKDWYTYEDMDGNTATITIAADLAVANGIAVFTSAGNQGTQDWFHITAPGDADSAVTVGAVDSTGAIWDSSSRGPTFDGRTKPDVCAMGDNALFAAPWDPTGTLYSRGDGTSLSCPLTAGVGALLLEANPALTPVALADALRQNANRASMPDNEYGWGVVQGHAALAAIATAAPERPAPAAARLSVWPNPSAGVQTISFTNPAESVDRVEIVDVAGRWVTAIDVPAGTPDRVTWDGLDATGRPVPTGIYFARLPDGGGPAAARIIRIR